MRRLGWVLLAALVAFVAIYYLPTVARCRSVGVSLSYCLTHGYL